MPVNLSAPVPSDLHPVPGVKLGIAMAGIRKANRRDLTVVTIDEGSAVAGVFTKNRFCAAPVQLCRERLASSTDIRALLINTGNANAGTGEDGLVRARASTIALARQLQLSPEQILPFSTGVIMETLPVERIVHGATLGGGGDDLCGELHVASGTQRRRPCATTLRRVRERRVHPAGPRSSCWPRCRRHGVGRGRCRQLPFPDRTVRYFRPVRSGLPLT